MTALTKRRLKALVEAYARFGFHLRVTSTDRTIAEQDALYRAGKTKLRGGESLHNFGRAADVATGPEWPPRLTSYKHIAASARLFGFEAVIEKDHVHLEVPPLLENP